MKEKTQNRVGRECFNEDEEEEGTNEAMKEEKKRREKGKRESQVTERGNRK